MINLNLTLKDMDFFRAMNTNSINSNIYIKSFINIFNYFIRIQYLIEYNIQNYSIIELNFRIFEFKSFIHSTIIFLFQEKSIQLFIYSTIRLFDYRQTEFFK